MVCSRALRRSAAAPPLHSLLAVVVVLALLSAAGLTPTPAAAAPGPVLQRTAAQVTADALPTAQVDGVVWSQAVAGDTVYAGGEFSSVRPAGAAAGSDEVARSNLMSYDIRTGAYSSFAPTFDGPVRAVRVSPDGATLYVAGEFTTVNGVRRDRFAAFSVATGALKSLAVGFNARVNAIAVIGETVYLGGIFNLVGSVSRSRLAAVDAGTGALTGWAPTADATVQSLVATPDHTGVVVAGSFSELNRSPALGMGALDAATGATRPWQASTLIHDFGENSAITALSADGDTVYGSGYGYGGGNFEGVFAADPSDGAIRWIQDCFGDSYDVSPAGGTVYSVGHAHDCANIGGFPDTDPRSVYSRALAVTKQATGTVLTNPTAGSNHGDFGGQPAPSLYNWLPDINYGTYTESGQGAWTVTGTSSYVLIGGEFTQVNGVGQQGLVRMAVPGLAPGKQGPRDRGAATAPKLSTASGRSVRITFLGNWDRDDQNLTYEVRRSNVVIRTIRATSRLWRRPTLTVTDLSGRPGASYTYKIRTLDPDGNYVDSPIVSATYPVDTSYARLVVSDGASHQWRLGGAPRQHGDPDVVGSLPLTASSGVTFGAPGAFSGDTDRAAAFAGTATAVATTAGGVLPAGELSVEAWFRTTSSTGGALVGAGAGERTGASPAGARQVYLTPDGRLAFAVRPDGAAAVTATSADSYRDGAWHQVVAVQGSAGLSLYVDGVLAASQAGSLTLPASTGTWGLGGATWSDLPSAPTTSYAGMLDDVSVFPAALSPRQVYAHFTTGQPRQTRTGGGGGTR